MRVPHRRRRTRSPSRPAAAPADAHRHRARCRNPPLATGFPTTHLARPVTGIATPNTACVSAGQSAKAVTASPGRARRTPARSPVSCASVCPVGVAMSIRSAIGVCRQVKWATTPSLPRRADSRPAASKLSSSPCAPVAAGPPGATVAQPAAAASARTAAAAQQAWETFTAAGAGDPRGARTSAREAPHGLQQDRVVGRGLQLRLPDLLCAGALALRPENFTQMRGNLGIGPDLERALEVGFRFRQSAQLEQCPSHAVENERIVGRQLERFLDQLMALGYPRGPVDQRVPQRIERQSVVRAQFHDPAQPRLRLVDAIHALRDHRRVVEQLR